MKGRCNYTYFSAPVPIPAQKELLGEVYYVPRLDHVDRGMAFSEFAWNEICRQDESSECDGFRTKE